MSPLRFFLSGIKNLNTSIKPITHIQCELDARKKKTLFLPKNKFTFGSNKKRLNKMPFSHYFSMLCRKFMLQKI